MVDTYLDQFGHFLGKMAAFKLWRDYQAARGKDFNLREFHERVKRTALRPGGLIGS